MGNELGHFALIGTFVLAILQILFCLQRHCDAARRLFWRQLSYAQALLTFASFALLVMAFATSDFSVRLVAEHSSVQKPWLFKFSGTWGNHEGSILLWLLILTLFGAWGAHTFSQYSMSAKTERWTLLSQAGLVAMFAAFIIWTSNPFERLFPIPLDGNDLNPLLQDIGLAIHPPLLYLGYVGFSVLFAFSIGGLMDANVDKRWAQAVRPMALAAWSFLTAGIAMGSWWASYELGWGGWWFWDPVENLSLLPWLSGTALIHCLLTLEKRNTLRAWTLFLALVTFAASMLGTFVVRSGVLTSVHSFAVDPALGSAILAIAVINIGFAFSIFALKAQHLKPGNRFQLFSRESAIVINNLFLCTGFATVFIGTFYPILAEAFGKGRPSVGEPFYHATFNPMMLLLLGAMVVGPLMIWRLNGSWAALQKRLFLIVPAGLAVALIIEGVFSRFDPLALGVLFVAASVGVGGFVSFARSVRVRGGFGKTRLEDYGMPLGHLGLSIAVVGMVGASVWVDEHLVAISSGETKALGDSRWSVTMQEPERFDGPNYQAMIVPLFLRHNKNGIELELRPERRNYPVRGDVTTELDTTRNWSLHWGLTDVFATLGQPTQTGRIVAKVVFRPLQIFLWVGAAFMALGGLVAMVGSLLRRQREQRTLQGINI